MRNHAPLLSILPLSFLLTASCGDYLDLEPDDPAPPDAAPSDPGPGYPPLPPPQAFPDEPVVTAPGEAPAPPPGDVDDGVHLVFPPPVSLTTARHVTVRGTARLAGGVAAVRVNGVAARLSPPSAAGAVAWQADVQVTRGVSELVVSSVDGNGAVTPAAASASITFSPDMLVRPGVMDLDVGHDRLFVSDRLQGFVAIDLQTGTPTRMPLEESADGPMLPYSLSIDAAAGRALFLFEQTSCEDDSRQEVKGAASIDLRDGAAVIAQELERYADCERGEAPGIHDDAVVLDASSERFFYLHAECADGACRAEVRGRPLGDGGPPPSAVPLCEGTWCSAIDLLAGRSDEPAGARLLALVRAGTSEADASYEVRAIDPVEGTQTRAVTVQTLWDGTLLDPRVMTLDAAGNRLFVLTYALTPDRLATLALYVIGIDLATGTQSLLIADVPTPDGTHEWRFVDGLYDPRRDRLIFSDETRGLIALDLATGAASLLFRPGIGEGPIPACPHDHDYCDISTVDATRQRLFFHVHDSDAGDIYVLDLTTGNRRLVSPRGSSIELGDAPRLLADDVEDRLLVVHENRSLYTVDGTTGARAYAGIVPAFHRSVVAWDPAHDRILYFSEQDGHALRAFDVDTGEDRVISSDTVGSGPSLRPADDVPGAGEMRVTLDASGTRAFLGQIHRQVLFSVDLTTGDRTAHAVGEPAGPADPFSPQPLLVDTRRDRLLVGQYPERTIGAVDLSTGAASTFIDYQRTDPPLWRTIDLLPDHARDRALVVDDQRDVHMLDLLTGQRVMILQSYRPGAPGF